VNLNLGAAGQRPRLGALQPERERERERERQRERERERERSSEREAGSKPVGGRPACSPRCSAACRRSSATPCEVPQRREGVYEGGRGAMGAVHERGWAAMGGVYVYGRDGGVSTREAATLR
jgi:hypothetical protein